MKLGETKDLPHVCAPSQARMHYHNMMRDGVVVPLQLINGEFVVVDG